MTGAPSPDFPAACLRLGATIIINKRQIEADDVVKGLFETALEPDEIFTEVTGPKVSSCVTSTGPRGASCVVGADIGPTADSPAACLGDGATVTTDKRQIEADDFVKGLFEITLEPDEILTTVTGPTVPVTGGNSDPHADSRAACLELGATISSNKLRIEADDIFKGLFETVLEPDDIITKVTRPKVALCATGPGPKVAFYVTSHAYAPCGGSDLRGRGWGPVSMDPFPSRGPQSKTSGVSF